MESKFTLYGPVAHLGFDPIGLQRVFACSAADCFDLTV